MKRLKIIHLITELNVGGAEQMLLKLVTRMDRRRFEPIVISATDKGPIGAKLLDQGIPVYALGMTLGRPTLIGCIRLIRFLRANPQAILQTWLYHADLLGLIAGRIAGIKRIVWGLRCSNMELQNYHFLTTLTLKLCCFLSPFVDSIIVNSKEGQAFHIRQGYSRSKMVYIPNGFEVEHFHPDASAREWLREELRVSRETILIGLIARFDLMKDHANFLKAASLLISWGKKVEFVLTGKGIDYKNKTLCSYLSEELKDRIHLLGFRNDMARITAGFDIATSSSAFGEGFSNTIGEAMACGIPCMVTDVGDSALIVGDADLVVSPKNPEALARAWEKLLELGETGRKRLGEKARDRIMKEYEIGLIAKRYEDFYLHLGL